MMKRILGLLMVLALAMALTVSGCKKEAEDEASKPNGSELEGGSEKKDGEEHPTGGKDGEEHPTGDKKGDEHPTGDKKGEEHPTGDKEGSEKKEGEEHPKGDKEHPN